ncbi:DEAD/DEAH box helicase [Paenibacillus tarimensis]
MNSSWSRLSINDLLSEKLLENGITEPTPVQALAIPAMLEGRDVVAHSQTGSGKTLAYLLPVLQRIDTAGKSVQAVVLAPTQELAMQIVHVAKAYGEPLGIRTQPLIGGAALKRQLEKLKEHPLLVIGTPGRIRELTAMRKLKLHETKIVIIDEVDQVFGLGSTREVEELLQGMNRDRQIAFFSATYPEAMAEMEKRLMTDPIHVAIEPQQRVAAQVKHLFLVSDKRDKVDTARRLIRLLDPASALLFLNDTGMIANWESKLGYEGFSVEALYGDADKSKRASTLTRFRSGGCRLLLATDVAARGLDIPDLPLVINLDPPVDADHYVHRAGRTGRMGRPGTVLTIVTMQELFIMDKFSKQLGVDIQHMAMSYGKLVPAKEVRPTVRKPSPASKGAIQPKKAAVKSARTRDQKQKGAPKWLKAKRNGDI